jgi:excisionase family DNA binding protein
VNALDRILAFVPGSVCARYAALVEDAVRDRLRRDGLPVGPELARMLAELREAGDAWRAITDGTAEATAEECQPDCRGVTLNVKAAADRLGTKNRNVVDLIARGRLSARRAGRAWRIDEASVDRYIDERRTA